MENYDFEKTATKVTLVSICGNIILSVFKLIAGIAAHSGAMVSDAVHSASDVFSSIVVIIGVKLSAKDSDKEHPYGHERFECVAAIVLSVVLLITGLLIGFEALKNILSRDYDSLIIPGTLALIAAVISIITKEAMYWYTRFYARRIDSSALMADAWHHRSDALSSIGALIGIAGARMGFSILDPVASLVICIFIAKAAIDIFMDAIKKMVDCSCDEETEKAICDCTKAQAGVLSVDFLHTRVFGNKIYVDIEIGADGSHTLNEAHDISEQVHDAIEETFPKVKHIMVHVNPYR
ncbi:cation diffusion facilitator family transporter [Faecalicatena contorta]|uniref:cation diffusion facilitator family transporter n=1 Tax=Faecalicatena contorta TaxID=39482 RepID=UPI001F369BD3|nr:cation diffusion facilitator family transporter [Faecalicatena contorta]MCF2555396.1 cation transporter [Faecalicatena contorta]MCF2679869.1 cation transporter [Faecalicatena contorta]